MRRALYNVCSTVQCTLRQSASNCLGQVYFMPPYHAIFTHLHMPSEWSSLKWKKMYRDYRNWRWQFYSHNPIPWVVQLISINRIWNLVIGEGFHSANKIQLCKNRWNLNAELQTWDTGGSRQRGGNLDSVELWWEISQNQWPRKSFVKIHPRMTPLRLCLCMFSESGKKLLGTFCNVSDFICLAVSELGWWRQWCKGYLCCG